MGKITYDDKVGITPRTVHINQVWDDDMNDIKNAINDNDSRLVNLESGGASPIVVSAIWQSGFTFDCTAQSYPINNVFYSAPDTTVTLSSSDATLDRIDLIVAKIPVDPVILGTIQVIEGTLATTELVVPPDYDPSEYFVIKQVIIRANATVPADENGTVFTTEKIYADGTGEPDEWTFSSNSGTIVNSGGVINATNPTTLHKATLTNDVPIPQITYLNGGSLSFKIKLKASLGNSYMFITWYNGLDVVSDTLLFKSGDYGLDGNSLDWQTIVINASEFNFYTSSDIDAIQIQPYKSFSGYELDDIQINVGGGVIIPTDTGNLQDVTNLGSITNNNITTQAFTSSGTRAGGDLVVKIGDYDFLNEGTTIEIDDANATINIGATGGDVFCKSQLTLVSQPLVFRKTYDLTLRSAVQTENRDVNFPDASGTILTLSNTLTAPTSNTDTGAKGEVRIVGGYRYECIATDTWVRSSVTTTF